MACRVVTSPPSGCQLLDLHNHTDASYDSSNTLRDYEEAHRAGAFDVLAVTDHNTIDKAVAFEREATFPTIVGEEVDTRDGELVGLFLSAPLPVGASAVETAAEIRAQGGIVYLQHPFYRLIRRPLRRRTIAELAARELIDVVEGVNGGPFMWLTDGQARGWAERHGLPCGAGSDAHHRGDIGRCVVAIPPGPVAADAVRNRLKKALLVDRRRSSLPTLGDRSRFAVRVATVDRLRRAPPRRRVPS